MLVAEGVVKRFGAAEVLRGVSLEVRRGEIFGFVGPNGCGKSTFLKCVVGVVRADGGGVRVGEVDALRDPLAARRLIAYAPSDTALYDGLSVAAMARFLTGLHRAADPARARVLLEAFELPLRRRVRALSHGMKRKLMLAAAIACGAPLMLLDEPMEGLDPEARRLVERLLREETARGRTVFFSSHDLASVERVCDRVAFLRGGRVVEVGGVDEVLGRAARVLWVRLPKPARADQLDAVAGETWTPLRPAADGATASWQLRFDGELADTLRRVAALRPIYLRDASGGLEDAFAALYGPEEQP